MKFYKKPKIVERIKSQYEYETLARNQKFDAVVLNEDEWIELQLENTEAKLSHHILLTMHDGVRLSVCKEGYWCLPKDGD